MGRIKEKFIDQINNSAPDGTDWDASEYVSAGFTTEQDRMADEYYANKYNQNQPEPAPIAEQADGKKCWEIKSVKDDCIYKIWAESYEQAIHLLSMIENI